MQDDIFDQVTWILLFGEFCVIASGFIGPAPGLQIVIHVCDFINWLVSS